MIFKFPHLRLNDSLKEYNLALPAHTCVDQPALPCSACEHAKCMEHPVLAESLLAR